MTLESVTDVGRALGTDYFLLRSELTAARRPTTWIEPVSSSRMKYYR